VAAIVLLMVMLAGCCYLSVETARIALTCSCESLWIETPLWSAAAGLMLIPLGLAVVLLRRKITTGQFLLNRSEATARRAEMLSKMGAGKPFWPPARYWAVPVLLGAVFFLLGALANAAAFRFGRPSLRLFAVLVVIAALFLFIPARMIFKAVQRKGKKGSYLPSEDELVDGFLNNIAIPPLVV